MKFLRKGVAGLLILATTWAPASMAQPDEGSVFGERVEVRVVNLEVVVTDRQGNRVSDLVAEDFQLKVDGKSLPISFFSEIADGQRVENVATLDVAPQSINPTGVEPGQPVGTSFLVFVDNFFSLRTRDRNQVLEGIAQQIPRLGPHDRMALVSFNGRKLNMLSPWTNSPSRLEHAFAKAASEGTSGIRTASAINDLQAINEVDLSNSQSSQGPAGEGLTGPSNLSASTPDGRAAASMQIIEGQLERVVLGVTATMRSFSQTPGRKVMLVLSGGWPQSVCDYLLGQRDPLTTTGECVNRGPELLKPIHEIANVLGYTLYPVDVPTGSSLDVNAAESDTIGLARNGPGIANTNITAVSSSFRQAEIHSTLRKMANETGGVAMINETRLASLDRVIDDTRSYYWLGFMPDWRGDDRNRKIKLEVNRPGLKVRYREGFKDLSRSEEVDFMVESTLLFGALPGTGRLGIKLGEIPSRGRKVKVPMEVVIPMDSITMLPHQGRYVAELELRIAALDEFGDRNEIAAVPVKLDGDDPPPEGAHAVYGLDIKIKRQPQDLVVSLYDPISDHVLVAKGRFTP